MGYMAAKFGRNSTFQLKDLFLSFGRKKQKPVPLETSIFLQKPRKKSLLVAYFLTQSPHIQHRKQPHQPMFYPILPFPRYLTHIKGGVIDRLLQMGN